MVENLHTVRNIKIENIICAKDLRIAGIMHSTLLQELQLVLLLHPCKLFLQTQYLRSRSFIQLYMQRMEQLPVNLLKEKDHTILPIIQQIYLIKEETRDHMIQSLKRKIKGNDQL